MKGKTVVLASILAMTSSFCLADDTDHPTFIFRSTNGEQIKNLIPSEADNRILLLKLTACYKSPIVGEFYQELQSVGQSINGDWITRENISGILTSDNYAKSDNNIVHNSVLAPGSCTGDYHDTLRIMPNEMLFKGTYFTCNITKESNIASYKPNGTNIVDIEANDPICHFNP